MAFCVMLPSVFFPILEYNLPIPSSSSFPVPYSVLGGISQIPSSRKYFFVLPSLFGTNPASFIDTISYFVSGGVSHIPSSRKNLVTVPVLLGASPAASVETNPYVVSVSGGVAHTPSSRKYLVAVPVLLGASPAVSVETNPYVVFVSCPGMPSSVMSSLVTKDADTICPSPSTSTLYNPDAYFLCFG